MCFLKVLKLPAPVQPNEEDLKKGIFQDSSSEILTEIDFI